MADGCAWQVHAETRTDPPEYCDEEAEAGSDYCLAHEDAGYGPDDHDDYKERLEDSWNWGEHDYRL